MTEKSEGDVLTDYVFTHYMNRFNLCDLCANTGVIDTTGIRSPAGVVCGGKHFCICPNGRALRARTRE